MYFMSLSQNYNYKLHNETILCMLSKNDIVVDKDAFEEIMENALTDMEDTDVRARYLDFKMYSIFLV